MKPKYFRAPKWFVELMEETRELQNKASEMLGVSTEWIKRSQHSAFNERLDTLTRGEREKMKELLEQSGLIGDYAWARFRYEHLDRHKELEHLQYDEEKKIIRIKKHPFEALRKIALDMKKKIDREFGGFY